MVLESHLIVFRTQITPGQLLACAVVAQNLQWLREQGAILEHGLRQDRIVPHQLRAFALY